MTKPIDQKQAILLTSELWCNSIIPTLTDYIRIPNKSPAFDPEWEAHGYMDQAMNLVKNWCQTHALPNMTMDVLTRKGHTPLLYIEVEGTAQGDDTLLLYGHLDKQPEMTGWSSDLGPWNPVLRDDKLYGRGGADDGYAVFGAMNALHILAQQNIPYHRAVIIIECSEESGSPDLSVYMEHLNARMGTPSLVICLDSWCGNYNQLWCTTSLRGCLFGDLSVSLLAEDVHSGDASGVIPSSFRVVRQLLSRLEDEQTGEIIPRIFHVDIPPDRLAQCKKIASLLGLSFYDHFPTHHHVSPVSNDPETLIINRTWKPMLSVIGAEGLPTLEHAGNVSRHKTTVRLSLRVPPTCPSKQALAALETLLCENKPYNAHVSLTNIEAMQGWNAPSVAPWLDDSLQQASSNYFGNQAIYTGEGGSIPFMSILGNQFPEAQFVVTGVLGPGSNAHGPNEFLHCPTAQKISCCMAQIIADHAMRSS